MSDAFDNSPFDNSSFHPGHLGWGEETESVLNTVDQERRAADRLSDIAPELVMRNEAKPIINTAVYDKIKAEMAKDNIEDGMDISYIELALFGKWFDWLPQIIGSCVGSGYMRLATWRTLTEVTVLGQMEELFGSGVSLDGVGSFAPFAPYNYRAGRRIAGMNSGDGSYCSVHIEGATRFGHLPCNTIGLTSDAFPEPQSASLYRQWGSNSGNALMDKFKDTAVKLVLCESEQVKETEDARTLLVDHFKGQMICSTWAFKPDYAHPTWKLRDGSPVWIYKRDTSAQWPHNMSIAGIVTVSGKSYVKVFNSWGAKAHKNGHYFYVPASLHQEWLSNQYTESRSVGDIDLSDSAIPLAW